MIDCTITLVVLIQILYNASKASSTQASISIDEIHVLPYFVLFYAQRYKPY